MESLKTALFEAPLYIYLSLVVAEFVLAAIWYERRSRRLAAWLAAPILLAGMVFGLEALVVTDREQITASLREIAEEVQAGDGSDLRLDTAQCCLDANVRVDLGSGHGGMDLTKSQALEAGRRVIREYGVTHVGFVNLHVDVEDSQAAAHFTTIVTFRSREFGETRTSLIWDVHWTRRDAGWRITRVEKPRRGLEF